MQLTEQNLKEFAEQANQGDKIYTLSTDNIKSFGFIAWSDKQHGFYALNGSDVTEAILISKYSVQRKKFFTDYEEAKSELWEKVLERVRSVDIIYFEGNKKSIDFLPIQS